MKIKLYIKIFLSFLLLLLISEVLIFGIFRIVSQRVYRDRFWKYVDGSVILFREAVEGKLKVSPTSFGKVNPELKEFITEFKNSDKHSEILKKVPISVVVNYDVSLYGACLAAMQRKHC